MWNRSVTVVATSAAWCHNEGQQAGRYIMSEYLLRLHAGRENHPIKSLTPKRTLLNSRRLTEVAPNPDLSAPQTQGIIHFFTTSGLRFLVRMKYTFLQHWFLLVLDWKDIFQHYWWHLSLHGKKCCIYLFIYLVKDITFQVKTLTSSWNPNDQSLKSSGSSVPKYFICF